MPDKAADIEPWDLSAQDQVPRYKKTGHRAKGERGLFITNFFFHLQAGIQTLVQKRFESGCLGCLKDIRDGTEPSRPSGFKCPGAGAEGEGGIDKQGRGR
jgi:hypothetical protein